MYLPQPTTEKPLSGWWSYSLWRTRLLPTKLHFEMKPRGGTCCTAVLNDFPSLGPYRDNFAMQTASTSSAEQPAAYHAMEACAQGEAVWDRPGGGWECSEHAKHSLLLRDRPNFLFLAVEQNSKGLSGCGWVMTKHRV